MKCKYDKCDNEVTGRQVYCSDRCRKAQGRKSDKVGQIEPKSDKSDIPSVIPEHDIPGPTVIPDVQGLVDVNEVIEDFVTITRATDPAVQAIWDGRNAQGQAAFYSEQATAEDYPQTQRPMR